MIYDWIATHGSPVDAVIIFLGMLVVWLIRYLVKSQRAQNVRMWAEIKEVKQKYNQLDKLTLLNSFLISDITGKKVVKIHRNGDYQIINPSNNENKP